MHNSHKEPLSFLTTESEILDTLSSGFEINIFIKQHGTIVVFLNIYKINDHEFST